MENGGLRTFKALRIWSLPVKGELADNPEFSALRCDLQENPTNHPTLTYNDELILQNSRIWLPNKLNFIRILLHEFHSTPIGGHMGVTKTMARLQDNFTWISIRQDIHNFVAQCLDCLHTKYVTRKPAGLLSPLPLPTRPWENIIGLLKGKLRKIRYPIPRARLL